MLTIFCMPIVIDVVMCGALAEPMCIEHRFLVSPNRERDERDEINLISMRTIAVSQWTYQQVISCNWYLVPISQLLLNSLVIIICSRWWQWFRFDWKFNIEFMNFHKQKFRSTANSRHTHTLASLIFMLAPLACEWIHAIVYLVSTEHCRALCYCSSVCDSNIALDGGECWKLAFFKVTQ